MAKFLKWCNFFYYFLLILYWFKKFHIHHPLEASTREVSYAINWTCWYDF